MRSLLIALLSISMAGAAFAGEEYMPLNPGPRAEPMPLRRLTSADPDENRQAERPALHRNMVTLQLPSLGGKTESRPRVVGAQSSDLDGSLDFHSLRPAPLATPAEPAESFGDLADIPGLIVPEILAMDQYSFGQPEPSRSARSAYPPPMPSRTTDYLPGGRDSHYGNADFTVTAASPAFFDDEPRPAAKQSRREYPEDRVPEGVAFTRIEIRSAPPPPIQPEKVRLPEPVKEPATRTALAVSPEPEPSELGVGPLHSSLAGSFEEIVASGHTGVPAESVPASGPVSPERGHSGRTRRVAPYRRPEPAPVMELKSALDPIYRQIGN